MERFRTMLILHRPAVRVRRLVSTGCRGTQCAIRGNDEPLRRFPTEQPRERVTPGIPRDYGKVTELSRSYRDTDLSIPWHPGPFHALPPGQWEWQTVPEVRL